MSNCCDSSVNEERGTRQSQLCATCGGRGKPVDTQTVQALVAVTLRQVQPGESHYFCATSDCPVVYYTTTRQFSTTQIRVPVHQKAAHDDGVPVCYCFDHSPASILAEWRVHGQTTVINDITEGIRARQCACEMRNPQGSCCLGNVRTLVATILPPSSSAQPARSSR
jgi:hypothetical protein